MWNDTDEPLAFLITFRTHGTWLHGDERGSINRFHNKYGTPQIRPEPKWLAINKERLARAPTVLNARQRATIRKAIIETCRFREWGLPAVNIRTNHAHAVVMAPNKNPSLVLNALKANATRLLRQRNLWVSDLSPWSDKGSTRYLWTEQHVIIASNYVEFGQGEDLPEFD